jgi:hypothetical protein
MTCYDAVSGCLISTATGLDKALHGAYPDLLIIFLSVRVLNACFENILLEMVILLRGSQLVVP